MQKHKPVETFKQGTLGFQVSKYLEEHRTAKCGEDRCRMIVEAELALGLPEDPYERVAWYDAQREKYKEWDLGRINHRWSWAVGQCRECKASETLGIKVGHLMLCVTWCLNTPIPEYPVGMPTPYVEDLAKHSENCTSHSWSRICESMENLNDMRSQWQRMMLKIRSSYTSSSSEKTKKPVKSSSAGRSQNLVLPNRKLPGFSIPKKSS